MNAITYAAAVFLMMGCSGSGGGGTDESSSGATATDSVDEADSADSTASTSGTDGADGADGADGTTGAVLPQDGTELCAFDPEKAGKDVGGSIENFGLKTYQGDAYWLHQNCGTDKKIIWIILATGSCGACESFAPVVQPLYEQYKDQGLEVMWVLGADAEGNPPSLEFCENFVQGKNVTFPVLRDAKFYQVYGHINPYSTALPHQYILDAETMELLHASGGVNDEPERVKALLGVE
jgi:thiol-disulfide isomerase/thioredoxin